jgi:subtilase family serine protease
MKTRPIILTALALAVSLASVAGKRGSVSPFLVIGPQATLAGVPGPSYGLFSCQVGLPGPVCYDPYQMRHAYHTDALINAGFDGRGKTMVIVDAYQSPNIVQQLNTFDTFYGLPGLNGLGGAPNPALGTFTQVAPDGLTSFNPGDPNMIGWAAEISLDVLWAHAIAPGANITLVLAKSNQDADILSATKFAVDNHLGDVISQSFGENESCMDPTLLAQQHEVFVNATQKGITLLASSGDFGSGQPTCDGSAFVQAVSSPAIDPLVTAVGGTELHAAGYCLTSLLCNPAANPAPGTYQGEIVWNESGLGFGATGGGFSVVFDEPSYQQGTIHGRKQRGVPDVSYNAAVFHGVLTWLDIPGLGAAWFLFGGTSAGSPQWAALTVIADQKAGHSLGYLNTALYHIGQAQSHYAASFFDVTSGNNQIDPSIPGFSAGPGWDATTGLGSPMSDGLVSYLIQFVSPGDGTAAIAGSKPHSNAKPSAPGHVRPH